MEPMMASPTPGPTRTATIADVARTAGVSPATVSRVLNGHPRVDPQLVERVTQAAAQISYVPNGAGRALRRQRSDLWAAIVPDSRNAFFTQVVEAFERVANADGYSVVLCNSREDLAREQAYIATSIAHQVSGVLIAATSVSGSRLGALDRAGIPVVTIDRRVRGFTGDTVTVDNLMVGQLAGQHLAEQGVRHPMLVTGPETVTSTGDREQGFLAAMAEAGIELPASRVLRLGLRAEGAAEAANQLLAAHPETDAIFATNGPLTSGMFLALRDRGLSMPDEVALIGVDDDHWTTLVTPTVTVVAQPVAQLGEWAGRLLTGRAQGHALDHARIVLDPTLIVRESSLRNG